MIVRVAGYLLLDKNFNDYSFVHLSISSSNEMYLFAVLVSAAQLCQPFRKPVVHLPVLQHRYQDIVEVDVENVTGHSVTLVSVVVSLEHHDLGDRPNPPLHPPGSPES